MRHRTFGKKLAIMAAGISLAIAAATACGAKSEYGDVILKTGSMPNTFTGTSSTAAPSCEDLDLIVRNSTNLSAKERRLAVIDNLAFITYSDANGHIMTVATAVRLTEGGYFATAAHVAEPIKIRTIDGKPYDKIALVHIATGKAYQVKTVLADEKADVAYIYAPNGNPQIPVRGIELSAVQPAPGDGLEMLAVDAGIGPEKVNYHLVSQKGTVTTPEDVIPEYRLMDKTPVRGMRPAGGFSGAPVINSEGKIAGIESGFFSDKALPVNQLERKDYDGSYVGPSSALIQIAKDACPK